MQTDIISGIIITGASKGLGKALVEAFVEIENCKIIALSRTSPNIETNANVLFLPTDLTDALHLQSAIQRIQLEINASAGRWVIINNFGTYAPDSLLQTPFLDTHLQHNFYPAYQLTQALLPFILQKPYSQIFNILSIALKDIQADRASYTLSKSILETYGKLLQKQLEPHSIKVTNVYLGPTNTHSWENVTGIDKNKLLCAKEVAKVIKNCIYLGHSTYIPDITIVPLNF